MLDDVLASAAIPAVLPPVEWEGRQLMDGGVKLVVLLTPCPMTIQPTDFAHADELIARSLSDAEIPR